MLAQEIYLCVELFRINTGEDKEGVGLQDKSNG
jgi:hypothetical protein